MSLRPRKRASLTNLIDFAKAVKRREEATAVAAKREDPKMEFLPFSFEESGVVVSEADVLPLVHVVIDREEGVGIEMSVKAAELLAKALRAAVRSAKKHRAG